ncbi:MAG: hypothetical protein KIT72_07215 [Polyangiaceae bacterium]|nr:hypothetical protein [Polyangiaceae bacterium]MCW5790193.1 hypothetical protein [Polyangiaceae bacterium]
MSATEDEEALLGAPERIVELALAGARFVHGAVGLLPDQTSDTLPLVDHYLQLSRAAVQERPELVPLITRSVGAYFGEVLRARVDGFWILPSDDDQSWRLCSRAAFLSLSPIGAVYDALFDGAEHPGPSSELYLDPADRERVEERLAALPEVRGEDYLLLSTRFDVVEIALAALQDSAATDGLADVRFGPEDYVAD